MNWWLILYVALVFINGVIGFFFGWNSGRKYQRILNEIDKGKKDE